MVGNQGIGGVRLPPKDWGTEIQAVRTYAHNAIAREHDERVAAHLELLAKMSAIGTQVEEHGRQLRDFAKGSSRRQWISGLLSSGAVIAAITVLGNVWTKRIEVQAPKASNDETAQTVSDLRKRIAELDDIVAEHRRALQQRPMVRDPDVVTVAKTR